MTIIFPRLLVPSTQLTTSLATYYTAPVGTYATLDKVTLSNMSGGVVTVDLHLIPAGGSASATNKLLAAVAIAANTTLSFAAELAGHILPPGAFLQALASAATSVALRVSGRETTGT